MQIEVTGRKVKVTTELRKMAEEGLDRIGKVAGKGATAHVVFTTQKHLQNAEITLNARHHTFVGQAEAGDLKAALRGALEKTEKQAIRWKKTQVEKKRTASPIKAIPASIATGDLALANLNGARRRGAKKLSGMHIVRAPEAMAEHPMTLEEAVKYAEAGNRDVLVFRDLSGDVKVLHCTVQGIVRLIEVS